MQYIWVSKKTIVLMFFPFLNVLLLKVSRLGFEAFFHVLFSCLTMTF